MPTPEFYDDFDLAAHREEAERLDAAEYAHGQNDLRNLTSEADARYRAAWETSGGRSKARSYDALHEAFEAAHPKPGLKAFQALAEWEWERRAFVLDKQGRGDELNFHILDRHGYIERSARIMKRADELVGAEFTGPLLDRARAAKDRPPPEPIPWPDPTALERPRTLADEPEVVANIFSDEGTIARFKATRGMVWYETAEVLKASMPGLYRSYRREEQAQIRAVGQAIRKATGSIQASFALDYTPFGIGKRLLRLRNGLAQTQEAIAVVDDHEARGVLRPAAHRRLRSLLDTLHDTSLGRYGDLRALYDGYVERVRTVLGGEKWDAPPPGPDSAA